MFTHSQRMDSALMASRKRALIKGMLALLMVGSTIATLISFSHQTTKAASISALCTWSIGGTTTVASASAEANVGLNYWPDAPFSVIKNTSDYTFFGDDGGHHDSHNGSAVRLTGATLDNPLASVNSSTNPLIGSIQNMKQTYNYIGLGPVYKDPSSGTLLSDYHAEIDPPNGGFYSLLGLAKSTDNGQTWTDLGEIIRFQVPYADNFQPITDIGDPPWVTVNDGGTNYFYFYINDEITGMTDRTTPSVVRAKVSDVINAAVNQSTVTTWHKYYNGAWTEPGIGGYSTSLIPKSDIPSGAAPKGYMANPYVIYNSYISRYVMVTTAGGLDASGIFTYESTDGLNWTAGQTVFDDTNHSVSYPTVIGLGSDPSTMGQQSYLYYVQDRANNNFPLVRRTLTCNQGASTPTPTPTSTPTPTPTSTPSGNTTIDDGASGWSYHSWSAYSDGGAYQGTAHGGNTNGGYGQYTFNGTGVDVYTWKGSDGGTVQICVDSTCSGTISLQSGSDSYNQDIYSATGLTSGSHTVKISGNSTDTSKWEMVDYIVVSNSGGGGTPTATPTATSVPPTPTPTAIPPTPTPGGGGATTTVDDNASGWTYSGWSAYSDGAAYQGTAHGGSGNGSFAQYTFSGTGIDVYTWKGPDGGTVQICVDTTCSSTLSLQNGTDSYNQKLYSVSGLSNGSHTVKITANSTNSSKWEMVDYIVVTA